RAEADALPVPAGAVANPWRTHHDRTDAGDDLTLGQVAVAHQASAAILGELVGVVPEECGNLRFDGMGQKGTGAAAQHLGQRIGKRPWLGKLENVTLGHGVSLLRWRSGGSNTPTIRRLYPFTPSPTSGHSSGLEPIEQPWTATGGAVETDPPSRAGAERSANPHLLF